MNHLLVLSYDSQANPAVLPMPEKTMVEEKSIDFGWGFAWYPFDENSVALLKDITSKHKHSLIEALGDWKRFCSTSFVCNLQDLKAGYNQMDLNPFTRTYAGREWIWTCSNQKKSQRLKKEIGEFSGLFEPLGYTVAELSMCWYLRKIYKDNYRILSEIPKEQIQSWFEELDEISPSNYVIADGKSIVIYRGKNSTDDLYILRKIPPHKNHTMSSSFFYLDMSNPKDYGRTMIITSSTPLSDEEWLKMPNGSTMMMRQAEFVWKSSEFEKFSKPISSIPQFQKPISVENYKNITKKKQEFHYEEHLSEEIPQSRKLTISHETIYKYEFPVEHSYHIFRLHPIQDHNQKLIDYQIDISVEGEFIQYDDVFGNQVIQLTVEEPFNELKIKSQSIVNIKPQSIDDFRPSLRRTNIPLVWMPWQRQMMSPYLLQFELPETQLIELSDYSMSFADRNDYDLLATLIDMNRTIYNDYSYVSGSSTLQTTPYDTYYNRKGVCQDFANLLILLTRSLSIPARYRVGYIYTGTDYENQIQSEASHAWVELYLPYLGWRGFDPTNGCLVNQDHIRVACGRNYLDATPTSGTIYKGGSGKEDLIVNVKVEEVD